MSYRFRLPPAPGPLRAECCLRARSGGPAAGRARRNGNIADVDSDACGSGGMTQDRCRRARLTRCLGVVRVGCDPAVRRGRGVIESPIEGVSMTRLPDKVALITGGESGIGLATARLFVAEGARVHLVGLDEAKLAAAAEELGDANALSTVADVTDEDAVKRAIGEGVDRYGRFDVLFSNAGISGAVAAIGEYP